MRIVGLNGIATHGERNIDILLRAMVLRGFDVLDCELPMRHWFSARWGGCSDGQLVARETKDGDILVAHSFGCQRAWYAQQVRDYRAIVCIAPAMSRKAQWRVPEDVHCFHSKSDWAIRIGARLVLHPFGAAGNVGFAQAGVRNYNVDGAGHNDYFNGQLLTRIADHIERLAA